MWSILLYRKYLLHAHFWVVSDCSLWNYFYLLCIRLWTCPEVKTCSKKWHALHFASIFEIRREKDISGCCGEATEPVPVRQQCFPWTSQGESKWRTGRPSSTTIVHWWKAEKPLHCERKGCFTTEMKCHKLLPFPACSEDKLFSEARCLGYFHHSLPFGHYSWHVLA